MSVKLYGQQKCPDCGRIKDWLRENGIEFEEVDVNASEEAFKRASEIGYGTPALPTVEQPGRALTRPGDCELRTFFGKKLPERVETDCVVIGGGPAGLTAALYLARERISCVVLEKGTPGGQINNTNEVENYPGFPQGIVGPELAEKLTHQARRFGAEVLYPVEVTGVRDDGDMHEVLAGETVFRAPAVIAATGSDYRRLGVPGDKELSGRGVSYCATCDGPFFRNKTVAVVGGGNTAVEESLFLLKFVKEVHLFHRRGELTAQKALIEELLADERVKVNYNHEVKSIEADEKGTIKCINVREKETGAEQCAPVQGVFVFIGRVPNTGCFEGYADFDEWKFLTTRPDSVETGKPGFFVAGDCRSGAKAQIATAVGDGTLASFYVRDFLNKRARS
ncbi:MAG: FAD-dependent oxidoreductase [Planctomycetota bacterium]|jgi:thioredoxin reductase (NADPH)